MKHDRQTGSFYTFFSSFLFGVVQTDRTSRTNIHTHRITQKHTDGDEDSTLESDLKISGFLRWTRTMCVPPRDNKQARCGERERERENFYKTGPDRTGQDRIDQDWAGAVYLPSNHIYFFFTIACNVCRCCCCLSPPREAMPASMRHKDKSANITSLLHALYHWIITANDISYKANIWQKKVVCTSYVRLSNPHLSLPLSLI